MSSSGLYGMFGPTLSGYLADKVGLDLPWWVWSLGAWLLVAALGVLRVDLNGRVLGVLLSAEILVLVVLSVAGLGDPASGLPLTSLSPGGLFGWDPMVRLFFWGGTTGAFGVLCLLVATSLAVLAFFAR